MSAPLDDAIEPAVTLETAFAAFAGAAFAGTAFAGAALAFGAAFGAAFLAAVAFALDFALALLFFAVDFFSAMMLSCSLLRYREDFFCSLTAQLGDLFGRLERTQSFDRREHDVDRIVRAKRLGEDVMNARKLEHRAH
jgi:hypothetical protein